MTKTGAFQPCLKRVLRKTVSPANVTLAVKEPLKVRTLEVEHGILREG